MGILINKINHNLLRLKTIEMDDIVSDNELLSVARYLTIFPSSGMNKALDYYRELHKERSVNALGIFAYHMAMPIGWALFTYESDAYSFDPVEGQACAQIFVQPEYRRQGVGSELIKLVGKMAQPDIVKVYDYENYSFFRPLINAFSHFQSM